MRHVDPWRSFLKSALGLGPRYRVMMVSPNGAQLAQSEHAVQQCGVGCGL